MRASDLIGRAVYDRGGRPLGRITDLFAEPTADGGQVVRTALVTPGHTGRLLGYSRPGSRRPWLVRRATWWLSRGTREVPWDEIRLEPPG